MMVSQILVNIVSRHLARCNRIDRCGWTGDTVAAGKYPGHILDCTGLIGDDPAAVHRNAFCFHHAQTAGTGVINLFHVAQRRDEDTMFPGCMQDGAAFFH